MLCTGWQAPSPTLVTSSRTRRAAARRALSTPAQVAGTGPDTGRADLGQEGRVEVGAHLRVGHRQPGQFGGEPAELGPGRRRGRGDGLRGTAAGAAVVCPTLAG